MPGWAWAAAGLAAGVIVGLAAGALWVAISFGRARRGTAPPIASRPKHDPMALVRDAEHDDLAQ
jgi:hypothetical protein